jgi:hypothetical protein
MEKEPRPESDEPTGPAAQPEEPPPFDPDPRLVTYLERGAKSDAEKRFRADMEKRSSR